MKILCKRLANTEGTIMIFALLVILVGAVVLAGWAQMLATATVYPDTTAEAVQSRVAMENARALARQYILTSLPSGTTLSNTYWVASISNGDWGGCSVPASGGGFWTNTNYIAGNPFSPFGNRCFVVTNFPILSNSSYSSTSRFLIKSRSPQLAGYPLVVHQTATTNLAGSWVPANKIYYTNTIPFNDFPRVPFTSGTNASGAGTNGYIGYFAAPLSAFSDTNAFGVEATGLAYTNASSTGATNTTTNMVGPRTNTTYWSGQTGLVLDSVQTNSIIRFDVPSRTNFYTNISASQRTTYTNTRVIDLTIVGSSTTNAMHIVVPTTNTTTTNITLSGTSNSRRIYLNKQSSSSLNLRTTTTTNSYNWCFGATLDNSSLTVNAPSGSSRSLTLTNGFRSDQDITLSSGTLNLAPATNASTSLEFIEIIADRVLWLEDGRNR